MRNTLNAAGGRPSVLGAACLALLAITADAQPFALRIAEPSLDRWMYPFNATPGTRVSAPVFGTLGDDAGVDSRHGQFVIGFDTFSRITPRLGSTHYLIRRARLTAMISRDRSFRHDPTADAFTSYLSAGDPAYIPDTDPGRPVELFGVGFRNGFTGATFLEDSPFGSSAAGGRNAYAAGYNERGELVDVGNNVGKTNNPFTPFEVHPFAIGEAAGIPPGELVPAGTRIEFELNLADSLVRQYLQEGLDAGRLRFAITGLHQSEFGGQPAWPDFFTRDNVLGEPPTLLLEGVAISSEDADEDGLPDDWERHYFGGLTRHGEEDPDGDGAPNAAEWAMGTSPAEPTDVLRISEIITRPDGRVVVRFPPAASRRYVLEFSDDARTWTAATNASPRFYAAMGMTELPDEEAAAGGPAGQRLYRIQAMTESGAGSLETGNGVNIRPALP